MHCQSTTRAASMDSIILACALCFRGLHRRVHPRLRRQRRRYSQANELYSMRDDHGNCFLRPLVRNPRILPLLTPSSLTLALAALLASPSLGPCNAHLSFPYPPTFSSLPTAQNGMRRRRRHLVFLRVPAYYMRVLCQRRRLGLRRRQRRSSPRRSTRRRHISRRPRCLPRRPRCHPARCRRARRKHTTSLGDVPIYDVPRVLEE